MGAGLEEDVEDLVVSQLQGFVCHVDFLVMRYLGRGGWGIRRAPGVSGWRR